MVYASQLNPGHAPDGGAVRQARRSTIAGRSSDPVAAEQIADLVTRLCAGLTAAAAMSFRVAQSVADASYFA